jgi:putative component of membrane protein insertase Oxa1/YidC/SpoIIIJ protein YidD
MSPARTIATAFAMLFSSWMFGQQTNDIRFVTNMRQVPTTKGSFSGMIQTNNEFQVLLGGLFLGYKRIFSSQDSQSCGFHPSCSVFAVEAMAQKGLVVGYFLAFDRISRCHDFDNRGYPFDPQTGLKLDHVSEY